jgi:hypothetical protein
MPAERVKRWSTVRLERNDGVGGLVPMILQRERKITKRRGKAEKKKGGQEKRGGNWEIRATARRGLGSRFRRSHGW